MCGNPLKNKIKFWNEHALLVDDHMRQICLYVPQSAVEILDKSVVEAGIMNKSQYATMCFYLGQKIMNNDYGEITKTLIECITKVAEKKLEKEEIKLLVKKKSLKRMCENEECREERLETLREKKEKRIELNKENKINEEKEKKFKNIQEEKKKEKEKVNELFKSLMKNYPELKKEAIEEYVKKGSHKETTNKFIEITHENGILINQNKFICYMYGQLPKKEYPDRLIKNEVETSKFIEPEFQGLNTNNEAPWFNQKK